MKLLLDKNDVLMSGNVLAGFELENNFENGAAFAFETEEQLMERLRNDPALAAELLSYEGPIIYMGAGAAAFDAENHTAGMRFRDGGAAVEGDNVYGKLLMRVRNEYAKEVREARIAERLVRPGQVVVDYVPTGEEMSRTEALESEGRRFIHTEQYRPVRWRFDASRNGTTGHAQRDSAPEVSFQTFECPFGVDTRSKVRVGSAAEASLLYERGLRHEIDWNKLFDDLTRRGLVKNMTRKQREDLIGDLSAQFDWMRDRICRDRSLAETPIVASSLLIPDGSFGRSIYDPDTAPAPAHILARYINNPLLLYSSSENGVLRALEIQEKDEPYRFSAVNTLERITLVIDGSDTIGGRVPGTRAVRERRPVYQRNDQGRVVYDVHGKPVVSKTEDVYKFQMKSDDEVETDYTAFKERLSTILANISPDVEVQLVTGTGVGVPQMVRRFVEEQEGDVYGWDYGKGVMTREGKQRDAQPRLSQLRLSHFQDVVPVLLGRENAVSFLLDENDAMSEVTFTRDSGIAPQGWATFSVDGDARNRAILSRGSLAAAAGLPVIHVQENRTEEEQGVMLSTDAVRSRDEFIGERTFEDSLFDGEQREHWDVEGGILASFIDGDIAIPQIAFLQDACVYVNSFPYHSVYSAYAAMLLRESGEHSPAAFRNLAVKEESMKEVSDIIAGIQVDDSVKERCMRNAVHLMAQSSSVFASSLVTRGTADFVCVSSFGDPSLFVDAEGNGQNRFGIVLGAERDLLLADIEAERQRSEAAARHIAEENVRLQKRANTVRAVGQKMSGGFPAGIEEAGDAIWFLGTDRPSQLCLPDDKSSFLQWEERDYGQDALNREMASRARLDDGYGRLVDNDFIFIFPSDELAVTGKRHVVNNPDAKDLTGVVRINPRTNKEFVCAYGIPVKKDNLYFELDNMFNRSSSFLSDRDSSSLVNAIISADALARSTALQQEMALCYAVRERSLPGGEENDDLTRVFMDKIWDYPRTREVIDRNTGKTVSEAGMAMPVEVNKKVYNRETQKYELVKEERYRRTWVDNPHAAPKLRELVKRYEKMLVEGASFPLNCICMPATDYSNVSEEKFLADFSFALSMANAVAVATDRPMRFPLDEKGKLWLGPDVPEKFREAAERKLDSFIGVVREENIINDSLPYIRRISIEKSFKKDLPLKGDGSDLYVRPNDLMKAFGQYDFSSVEAGNVSPIHEMAFTMDDGTLFRVTNPRLTKGMPLGEINRYMRYEKNDECRFTIKSSDPDRIPEFMTAFKSYLERAKRVKIEMRLLSEADALAQAPKGTDALGLDGYIRLLSSNSDKLAVDPEEVAARGPMSAIEMANRFDGTDNDSPYYGKEEARDAFSGYAQFRYTLPDGSQSDWVTVTDKEIALDIVYSNINRVYRSDVRVVPTRQVLEAEVTSLAIEHAGEAFRSLSQEKRKVEVDTKVVESERFDPEKQVSEEVVKGASEDTQKGRVFVTYYGSHSIPSDAFKVQMSTSCPPGMKEDMDVCFKTLYPDYKTMVEPHKKGEIDDAEYTRRYVNNVLEPNKDKILDGMKSIIETAKEEGKDVYLYCYCKPGSFCHRYLVDNFLNINGIECRENEADRKLYREGHVRLFEDVKDTPERSALVSMGSAEGVIAMVGNDRADDIVEDLFQGAKGETEDIVFTTSDGNYGQRTDENAMADDVDFTLQFAVNFKAPGEVRTAKAAGDSCVPVEIPLKDGHLDLTQRGVGKAVQQIINLLPEDFVKGEPFSVNLAGHRLNTLKEYGSQDDFDVFMAAVAIEMKRRGVDIRSWRSGGQTGIDETAVVAAHATSAFVRVHGPKNWLFCDANGRDIKGDEKAFKARFEKDYTGIIKRAEELLQPKRRVSKKSGQQI